MVPKTFLRSSIAICVVAVSLYSCTTDPLENVELTHGAITRFNRDIPDIFLVFTGHEFADGFETIFTNLKERNIKASFFLTGDFYRDGAFEPIIKELVNAGHYLGAHSDKHLLYASWDNRDSLLVTKDQFLDDLDANYNEMSIFGISKEKAPYFLPPFEWYNATIAEWTRSLDLTLINFSPGTDANQDWSYPGEGIHYYNSDTIFQRILRYEEDDPNGLNGFILLLHIGVDPRRPDKFYHRLPDLIDTLKSRGYAFRRLPS